MTMTCTCGARMHCVDTRNIEPQVVRRRHKCGFKFTTRERVEVDGADVAGVLTDTERLILRQLVDKVLAGESKGAGK